jgi:hypothetical protein
VLRVRTLWATDALWSRLDREARAKQRRDQAGQARKSRARRARSTRSPAPQIDADAQARLAKILGMLGSQHEGERLAAAAAAEALRKELGANWADLLKSR